MKLCHVITKPELGGAQLSTLNILSRLSKEKYDISLITCTKGLLRSDFENLKKVKCHFLPSLHRPINPLLDIWAFIQIYFIFKRNKFAIVHTHSSKAGIIGRWAARFARVQVIIHTVHGWSFNECQNLIRRKIFISLERITARFTTKIICVCKKDIETALKHGIAKKDKFALIKYGIPILEIRGASIDFEKKRRELGILNNDPVIGMISCLKPQKSPLDFIKASIKIYEKEPRVNFLLVGDGALRAKCERLLARTKLNGRFIFTGWRRDIPEILEVMDMMILTSKWEGMPISIIEALCKGRPVIATGVGGTPELIKDGVTGFITKPGFYEEVAEKVLKMLKDSSSLSKMKIDASSSIDDSFNIDRMVTDIKNLYEVVR